MEQQNTNSSVAEMVAQTAETEAQSETKSPEQIKAELDAERKAAKDRKDKIRRLQAQLAATKKAQPKISRYAITAQVILANTGLTVKELSALADAEYVKAGGNANARESEFTTGRTVSALAGVGLVKSNGHVTVIGTVTAMAAQQPQQPADNAPSSPDTAPQGKDGAATAPQGKGKGKGK